MKERIQQFIEKISKLAKDEGIRLDSAWTQTHISKIGKDGKQEYDPTYDPISLFTCFIIGNPEHEREFLDREIY